MFLKDQWLTAVLVSAGLLDAKRIKQHRKWTWNYIWPQDRLHYIAGQRFCNFVQFFMSITERLGFTLIALGCFICFFFQSLYLMFLKSVNLYCSNYCVIVLFVIMFLFLMMLPFIAFINFISDYLHRYFLYWINHLCYLRLSYIFSFFAPSRHHN